MPNHYPIEVMVTVAPESVSRISEIAILLKAQGLTVTAILKELGVIVGSTEPARLGALSDVEGVCAVERSPSFDIGTPDQSVQ